MEIQKKEIIIKPKRKKMDDSKNGDYFLFCRNKKCNQPIYKNRSHFDTRYCDECCQRGNMKDKEKGYKGFGVLADDFHHFANSIYDRWDEGLKPKKKHMDGLLNACKDFIKLNKQWEKKNGKQLGKKN